MKAMRFNPRSGIAIFLIAIVCNVIMLHQWLSSACCQEMVSCQISINCSVDGCYDCAKTPVLVEVNLNNLIKKPITTSQSITKKVQLYNQKIWRPPKEVVVCA